MPGHMTHKCDAEAQIEQKKADKVIAKQAIKIDDQESQIARLEKMIQQLKYQTHQQYAKIQQQDSEIHHLKAQLENVWGIAEEQEEYIEDIRELSQIVNQFRELEYFELFTTEDESGCQKFGAETPYGIIGLTEPDFLRLSSYEGETPTTVSHDPVAEETAPSSDDDSGKQSSEQDHYSYASMVSKSPSQPQGGGASDSPLDPVSEILSSTSQAGGASDTQKPPESGYAEVDIHTGRDERLSVYPSNNKTVQAQAVANVMGSIIAKQMETLEMRPQMVLRSIIPYNGLIPFAKTGFIRVLVRWFRKPDGQIFIDLKQVRVIEPTKLSVTLREKEGKMRPFAKITSEKEEEVYLPQLKDYFLKPQWEPGDTADLICYVVKNIGKQEWMLHVV